MNARAGGSSNDHDMFGWGDRALWLAGRRNLVSLATSTAGGQEGEWGGAEGDLYSRTPVYIGPSCSVTPLITPRVSHGCFSFPTWLPSWQEIFLTIKYKWKGTNQFRVNTISVA